MLCGYEKWLSVSQMEDAEDCIMLLNGEDTIDCLIVDNYAIDKIWEKRFRNLTKKIMILLLKNIKNSFIKYLFYK